MEVFKLFATFSLIDQISGPLRHIESSLAEAGKTAAGLSGQIIGTAQSMRGLAAGSTVLLGAIGGCIATAASFEQAMAGVGAVSGATGKELEKLTNQARELGATTVFSATQAADAQKSLAQAGFTVAENLAALPGVMNMAAAGGLDLGRATDVAANTLRGFGLAAGEMGRVGDVLVNAANNANTNIDMLGETMKYVAPVARGLGVSLEETAALAGLLGNVGIQGGQAGTVLRASLGRLAAPVGSSAAALKELGVSVKDTAGNMRSPAAILGDMSQKMQNLSDAAKAANMKAIFGEEAMSGMLALTSGDSVAKLQELTATLRNSAGASAAVAEKQTATLSGALKGLSSAFESLRISIGTLFLPTMRFLITTMTKVTQFFDNLSQSRLGSALVQISAAAAVGVVGFVAFAKTLAALKTLLPVLSLGLKSLGAGLGLLTGPVGLVIAAVAALALVWKFNIGGMGDKMDALWNKIKLACKGIVAVLQSVNSDGIAAIDGALGRELKAAGLLGLVTTVSKIIYRIEAYFKGFFGAIYNNFGQVFASIEAEIKALEPVFRPILNLAGMALGKLADLLGLAGSTSISGWSDFGAIIGNILTFPLVMASKVINVFVTIVNGIHAVYDEFINIFTQIKNIFASINFFESGKKLLLTLAEGVKAAAFAPVDAVAGALGKVRQYLPFSDAKVGPLSTLTLSGERLMETLGHGAELAAPELAKTISDSLETAAPSRNMPAAPGWKSQTPQTSRNYTINISKIELPAVQNGSSFINELKELVFSLEGAN